MHINCEAKNTPCSLEKVFHCRWLAIQQLAHQEILKREFILMNIHCIKHNNIMPFHPMTEVHQGFYNYFYYNTLAKSYMDDVHTLPQDFQRESIINSFIQEAHEMYQKKDQAIAYILSEINYQNVSAYYLEMASERLNEKLFEIVLLDYPQMILHSKNFAIQKSLSQKKLFLKHAQPSKINHYVNQKC